MTPYLEAHNAFVEWLNGAAECEPTAADVERALFGLARCAADRGMSDIHWIFVVDGLIAHAKRRCPDNAVLPDYLARGVDLSATWSTLKTSASTPTSEGNAHGARDAQD
jgi:hypothetical protein